MTSVHFPNGLYPIWELQLNCTKLVLFYIIDFTGLSCHTRYIDTSISICALDKYSLEYHNVQNEVLCRNNDLQMIKGPFFTDIGDLSKWGSLSTQDLVQNFLKRI